MQLHLDGLPELARPGARPESEVSEFSVSTGRWPVLWSPCPLAGRKSVPARRNAKRSAICSPEAPSLCLQVPSASQGDPRPRLTPSPAGPERRAPLLPPLLSLPRGAVPGGVTARLTRPPPPPAPRPRSSTVPVRTRPGLKAAWHEAGAQGSGRPRSNSHSSSTGHGLPEGAEQTLSLWATGTPSRAPMSVASSAGRQTGIGSRCPRELSSLPRR